MQTGLFLLSPKPPGGGPPEKGRGIIKGSGEPNRNKVGQVTRAQVKEIAQTKLPDLNTTSLESAVRTVEGAARSMGIEITEG